MESRKLISRIVISCLIVIGFVVSVGFASHKQSEMPCSGIAISIEDGPGCGFVDEMELRQIIQNKFGTLEGKTIASINISMLEKIINTNPFIYDAEVFSTIDGKLNIDVKQRIPVLRVINYKNESFYIDKEGVFMPSSEKFTARVPIANGFIYDRETEKKVRVYNDSESLDTSFSSTKSEQLFHIISFANKSEFWNAEVQQLYVNAAGDIEMIPRVGNHTVILGDDKNLDEKFTKLLAFYLEGLNKKGWNKYSSINLKFKDQVVCTKK
jgi:cell division protein FtsQ